MYNDLLHLFSFENYLDGKFSFITFKDNFDKSRWINYILTCMGIR